MVLNGINGIALFHSVFYVMGRFAGGIFSLVTNTREKSQLGSGDSIMIAKTESQSSLAMVRIVSAGMVV